MRIRLMVFLFGVLMLVLAAPAFAGNQAGTVNLSPFTGATIFDSGKHMDNGQINGLRAGYNFTTGLGAEAFFGYTQSESRYFDDLPVDYYHYGIDFLYHFMPNRAFVPFIAAGLGIVQGNGPSAPTVRNHALGAVDFGLGFKYFLCETIALRGDAREVLYREAANTNGNIELTIGVTLQLGAEKKAVAAIPPAAYTTPPTTATDTAAPTLVCTSPDNGVTGVAISRNINATFSEEMAPSMITTSTYTVKRGTTPVPGKVTYSGTTATFIPESELEKGATYTATMEAGVKDRAGNALANTYVWSFTTVPAPKEAALCVLIMLEDSHFLFDSAEITENGKTILNHNIDVLKTNPKMKIRIAGYTSAAGTKEYNQKLSERRATAVREYIVKVGGIDRDRLTTIGYGEARPAEYEAVPSDIYSGAAHANMRVLFEIIVQ